MQSSSDNSQLETQPPLNLDQEVDLFEYLHALLSAKYRILIVAVIGAIAVFGYSKTIEDTFSSTALVAININSEPGGVAPKNYRAGDSLSLIEYDLVINSAADNEQQRLLARMKSAAFTELFITENDLTKYIYNDKWDPASETWLEDFKPSMTDAVMYFKSKMRSVAIDEKTKLLQVNFVTRDPRLSAELANKFFRRFNKYIQEMEASEIAEQRKFLESRLEETSNLEIQRSIYRMLETQLASEALIFAKNSYPLEEIQPALPPQFKSSPQRKTWAILAFVGIVFAGVVVVLTRVVISKISSALKAYGNHSPNNGPLNSGSTADSQARPVESRGEESLAQAEPVKKQKVVLSSPGSSEKVSSRAELDEWLD